MSLNQAFLSEFDREMSTTRRLLERVPDDKLSWKPHPKSMSLGQLASHLTELASWATVTLTQDELDLNPPGGPGYTPLFHASTKENLEAFDANVGKGREAIAAVTDEVLFTGWTLKSGGEAIFTLPKVATLRSFVFNHIIHHRGQLSVYLRLNDVSVPSIYGPSADEGF